MPQIHLVLADYDFEYVNHLAQWFIENKPNQFKISSFTEKESFKRFISENKDSVNIILAREDFLIESTDHNVESIVLGQAVELTDLPAIEKYQPAPSICSDILSVLSNNQTRAEKWFTFGKSHLIACFSTNIYLKSTLALLLSYLSTDYVYISLDSFPLYKIGENFQAYNKNLSDILYHIKSQKGNPVIALESAVFTDSSNINFIPPLDNPKDLWELTDNEADIFIEALTSWGHFSKIIADLECNTGPITIKLLEAASNIFIPFDKTHLHQIPRIKSFLNSIRGLNSDKIAWIFCGRNEEILLSEELDNLHELLWLNESIATMDGFSLDTDKRRQLEGLLN